MKASEIARWLGYRITDQTDCSTLEKIWELWPEHDSHAHVDWDPLGRLLMGLGYQVESDASLEGVMARLKCVKEKN